MQNIEIQNNKDAIGSDITRLFRQNIGNEVLTHLDQD